MKQIDTPQSEAQAIEAVASALAERTPLRITGGGTRAGLGRPVAAARGLSAAKLSGITLYEPAEMVIGAKAGTPLAEIEATLAEKGQRLPFEPMDHRAILGSTGTPTIGAVAAGNISGPRRVMAGAARDALIGVRYVNGRAEAIKNGGRVMKNVTGLDLVKFQAGAYGTLGFLTEVTFRVVPRAEQEAVLVIEGLDDARAIAAMSTALTSPYEMTGTAHLPADVAGGAARTLFRLEGFADSVSYRTRALRHMLAGFGKAETLASDVGSKAFADLRDAKPLAAEGGAIWRLSVKPSLAAQTVAQIRAQRAARVFYDWGGGLIWLATGIESEAGAGVIRAAAKAAKGYATLQRAPEEVRVTVPPFEPEAPALAALTKRIKTAADPAGIFNPGLMFAGV
ncbi:MAG: FAD-binding protein [Proteobacteria bacterium]|nr:FAD-binding protein [Pseudomonadota bacterium]